jgi:transcriptional regulator with XRE-family HTH domain
MQGKEIIKNIMSFRKWTQATLAKETQKTPSHISGYLNRGTKEMRMDIFVELVNAMGCEVVVRDKMGTDMTWVVKNQ